LSTTNILFVLCKILCLWVGNGSENGTYTAELSQDVSNSSFRHECTSSKL